MSSILNHPARESDDQIDAWHEWATVQEGVELGYLCPMDGAPCEIEEYSYKYGEDADGNRGEWRTERRCRKCGEYPHDD